MMLVQAQRDGIDVATFGPQSWEGPSQRRPPVPTAANGTRPGTRPPRGSAKGCLRMRGRCLPKKRQRRRGVSFVLTARRRCWWCRAGTSACVSHARWRCGARAGGVHCVGGQCCGPQRCMNSGAPNTHMALFYVRIATVLGGAELLSQVRLAAG